MVRPKLHPDFDADFGRWVSGHPAELFQELVGEGEDAMLFVHPALFVRRRVDARHLRSPAWMTGREQGQVLLMRWHPKGGEAPARTLDDGSFTERRVTWHGSAGNEDGSSVVLDDRVVSAS